MVTTPRRRNVPTAVLDEKLNTVIKAVDGLGIKMDDVMKCTTRHDTEIINIKDDVKRFKDKSGVLDGINSLGVLAGWIMAYFK
jgi:hypothetical protein